MTTETRPYAIPVSWGTVGFDGAPESIAFAENSWIVQGERQGQGADVTPIEIKDLSGGLLAFKGIADWASEDRARYWRNTGVYGLWLPGGVGVKSYATTTQTGIITADFSNFSSGNNRVHSVLWPTSSGLRQIFGVGANILKDTSVSNPAVVTPATADNVADEILAMWIGPDEDGAQALWIATDGTSDDVKYTLDPLADSITWVSGFTYPNAADEGYWGAWMPGLGGGWHVAALKLNDGMPALYAWKQDAAPPLTSTSAEPVVYSANRDEVNADNPLQETGLTLASDDTQLATTALSNKERWQNTANVTTDDGAYAVWDTPNTDPSNEQNSNLLIGLYKFRDSVPASGVTLEDVPFSYQRLEENASANIFTSQLLLVHDPTATLTAANGNPGDDIVDEPPIIRGSVTVVSKNEGDSTEWDTTVEEITGTFSAYLLTPAIVRSPGFGLALAAFNEITSTTQYEARVEAMKLNIRYRRTGFQVKTTEGSWSIGPMPSHPTFIPEIGPVFDNPTGVNTQRELRVYEFAFDVSGDRPVVSEVHRPETGLAYCQDMCHFQDGIALMGGAKFGGLPRIVFTRQEGSNWVSHNLGFPPTHGDVELDVTSMTSQDDALIVDTCAADGSDAQRWMFTTEVGWHPFGALQSLSGTTIATKPLLWAERTLNLQQSIGYRFFPNSTTNLHVAREFVPDLFNDPRLTNTSQAKVTSATRLTLLHMNYGPPELLKTLLSAEVQNYEVDDGTSFETLRVLFDENGDLDLSSPGFDHTFDASTEVFTPYYVRSAGLQFDTGVIALELGAGTGTKTPNALPVLLQFAGQYESDRTFTFVIDKPEVEFLQLVENLERVKRTKSAQILSLGSPFVMFDADDNKDIVALFVGPSRQRGQRLLQFREVAGATSAT